MFSKVTFVLALFGFIAHCGADVADATVLSGSENPSAQSGGGCTCPTTRQQGGQQGANAGGNNGGLVGANLLGNGQVAGAGVPGVVGVNALGNPGNNGYNGNFGNQGFGGNQGLGGNQGFGCYPPCFPFNYPCAPFGVGFGCGRPCGLFGSPFCF